MKAVLVTGAAGFIGQNLCATLEQDKEIEILRFDRKGTLDQLAAYLKKAEFVFHLAGINRPKNEAEFDEGNRGLTQELLDILAEDGKRTPVAMTSSIQAELDNAYGKSKKASEEALFGWSENSGNPAYVYRLPNVFGKWSKPDYNSVVATFCHNIANGLPIKINESATELELVYIDDVVKELVAAMNGSANPEADGYCYVKRKFKTSLQELADTIHSFVDARDKLVVPNLEGDFERFLYATFTSFYSPDNFGYELEMRYDDRGWLAEFIKSSQFGQIFISRTKPGITRGNHWHNTKIEKFLVIDGEAEIIFRRVDSEEVIKYQVSGKKLNVIDIPAGYTHSITNTGSNDLVTLFWADEIFNPEESDTYFLEAGDNKGRQ